MSPTGTNQERQYHETEQHMRLGGGAAFLPPLFRARRSLNLLVPWRLSIFVMPYQRQYLQPCPETSNSSRSATGASPTLTTAWNPGSATTRTWSRPSPAFSSSPKAACRPSSGRWCARTRSTPPARPGSTSAGKRKCSSPSTYSSKAGRRRIFTSFAAAVSLPMYSDTASS